MNRIFFAALSLLSLLRPGIVQAQQLYRCGNTFSQTPCAPDAKAQSVRAGAAADKVEGLSGYDLCASVAPKAAGFPEPDTAQVQPAGDRKSEVIQYAGQPTAAFRYDLNVNAKTVYGVMSGPQAYSCWVSEDQRRVLQLKRRN
jgi:hypothetical protein